MLLLRWSYTAVPSNQYDWPNPAQPYRIDQTWTFGLPQSPLATRPFTQLDWPNPVQPYRIDQTWTARALTARPFAQFDWPLPVQPSRLDQTWTARALTARPFAQLDWPLPVQPSRIDQTWTVRSLTARPFAQLDWPNPIRAIEPDRGWIGLTPIQFITATATAPFAQFDWPNPIRAIEPDRGWVDQGTILRRPPTLVPLPPPSSFPPRPNSGIVVVVDLEVQRTYGSVPGVGVPFSLIINMNRALVASEEYTLLFTSPSGHTQLSDSRYVYVGTSVLLLADVVLPDQYLVYNTAAGEFAEAGLWQVTVQTAEAGMLALAYLFTVETLH
jgi:hypothetical protein